MYNTQDRFSFIRLLTFGGIAFLLLGLLLSSSAQADTIYAVRVNALNAAGNGNNYYSNYNFSNTSGQWVTETTDNTKPYTVTSSTIPIMLCDLGAIQTINSIKLDKYGAAGNNVKAMTLDFYDSPALSGTPVYSQTFTNISKSGATLTLDTPTNARFVKFTMTENHGDNRYGVGNITFDVSSVVTPTSGSVSVNTYSGMSVANLFDKNSGTQWCSASGAGSGNNYFDKYDDPVFTFQLGAAQTLIGITVQAYGVSGNSIKNFELEFLDSTGNTISVDASKYKFAMTDATNLVQNYFSFPEVEGVKQVKMTVTSNFTKNVGDGGDRIGLSEVYFSTIETQSPTTPEKYDSPMHEYNIVRPTGASYVYDGSSRSSDSAYPLTNLFDGDGTSSGSGVWCTRSTGNGSDYFNKGYSPVIDFDMPSETMYDSFSIWGYFDGYLRSQLTDFILELFDSNNNLVFADEFKITQPLSSANFVTFSLGGNYLFSKARLTALDNGYYWFVSDSGDRVGFAEIAFYQEPYYFANASEISADNWTINGTSKQGVKFTDCEQTTATFAKPITLDADGTIEVAEGKKLLLTGGISGQHELKKTGDGLLQINSAAGAVDVQSLVVSSGRLDMKTYFKGSLVIGEELEEGSYTKATFSPGNSIGTLTVDGSFTLNPGSILLMEVGTDEEGNPAADQLIVTGNATFEPGSFIYLDLDENSSLVGGDTLNVILQANNSASFGDDFVKNFVRSYYFTGLEYTQMGDGTYAITATLDPNAVPEPSTWALMALGVAFWSATACRRFHSAKRR